MSPNPANLAAAVPACIVLLTGGEAAALHFYFRHTGRGIPLAALLPNLLAGDCLLLALAVALARGGWIWIGLLLLGSLLCHLNDLARRWRR